MEVSNDPILQNLLSSKLPVERITNESSNEKNEILKILLVGPSASAKTTTLIRYADNMYIENLLTTIGIDFKTVDYKVDNKIIKLQIWDSAGAEKFRGISSSYMQKCQAVIVFFDISDPNGLSQAQKYVDIFKKNAPDNCLLYLNASKYDLKPAIPYEKVIYFSYKNNIKRVFYTSAKKNLRINQMFEMILCDYLKIEIKEGIKDGFTRLNGMIHNIQELVLFSQDLFSPTNSSFDEIQKEIEKKSELINHFLL